MPTFKEDLHLGHEVALVNTDDIRNKAVTTEKLDDEAVTTAKLADGAVTTEKIADGAVTTDKIGDGEVKTQDIADGAVTSDKIPENNIVTDKIHDGAVTTPKIANGAVTTAKIGDNEVKTHNIDTAAVTTDKILDDAVVTAKIQDKAVTTSKIADENIVTGKIGDEAVTTPKIANGAVTTAKIPDDAVTTNKIADRAITTPKILDSAITEDKIADSAITNSKVQNGTLSGTKFQDASISGTKILDNSVPGSKLQDGTIEGVDIKDGTLSGAKLVNNSVDGEKLADNAIESRHLIDNSIPASKIKDGTIESVDIKDGTLSGAKIKDNTIESGKLADSAVSEAKIANGAVTTAKINDGAVTTGKLDSDAVTTEKIANSNVTTPKIADEAVTTDKIPDGGVTTQKIADEAVTTDKIPDGGVTTAKINNGAVTTEKIDDEAVTEDKLAPGAVTTAKLADGVISEIENITDAVPTKDSVKPMQSGGVLTHGSALDISELCATENPHTLATYADLPAALAALAALPSTYRKGGMSIKFVCSSDNKYVQYRLMSDDFSTTESDWQGVDDEPTAGSNNLVKSGGAYTMIHTNRSSVKNGYFYKHGYVQTNGNLHYGDENFLTTDLVQFDRTYPIKYKGDSGNQYVNVIAFYNKDKQYIAGSGISNIDISGSEAIHIIEVDDIPSDAIYFASTSKLIQQNSSFVEFKLPDVPFDVISEILGEVENIKSSVKSSLKEIIGVNIGYNKFDTNVITDQKYIKPSNGGEENASSAYPSFISDYIEVTGFESINIVLNNGSLDGAYGYAFYDNNYNILDYGIMNILIEKNEQNKNAKYFRFSQPTSKLYFLYVYVQNYSVRKPLNDVSLISRQPNGLAVSDITINAGSSSIIIPEVLTNYDWQLAISCDITTISSYVRIQKGDTNFGSSYIDIYPSKVVECYMPSSRTKEYQFDFTLGTTFGVILTSHKGKLHLVIISNAGVFEQELLYFDGTKNVLVSNGTGNSTLVINNASVNYTKGFMYKIALFGDSYAHERWGNVSGFAYNYSWTTNLKQNGCHFENIGYPGANSANIIPMMEYYIKYASPNIIIWALGMNDVPDSDDTPNATWLSYLLQAKSYAESLNALLIPCTIPSVPNRNHDAKTTYIKQHFARYIDFAECLTDNGSWKSGYLASDNVHPTALGFAAMISQALKDVPEFNY